MTRTPEVSPGQIRFNVFAEEPTIIVPNISKNNFQKRFDLNEVCVADINREKIDKKGKPDVAYMNSENLGIIRERIAFQGSDKELINNLIVFRGNPKDKNIATEIRLDPKEEKKKGYKTRLNISIIAQEALAIDDFDVPDGCKFYQLLGVYSQYKGTGKVSTDKCTRNYATIQRSNCPHPEYLYTGGHFFANPDDAIKVKRSKYEKTGYYWSK